MTTLPRIALSDHHRSPFDEAVLIIGDREEETITIECPNARELAAKLAQFVNRHTEILGALTAATHALRSYQCGNSAPDLAQEVADACERVSQQTGDAA